MRKFLSRSAAAAAVLLVALPVAAGAAVDEYAAEASTSAVKLAVFEDAVGSPLLDLVNSEAFAASDPTASAMVGAIEVLGEQVIPVVEATSDGDPARDPAEGDGCVELADASGLTLDAVCGVAAADAGASDEASANAHATLLDVGVDGSLVAGLLTTPLTDFVDVLTQGAEDEAIQQFTAACDTTLATATEPIPPEVPGTVEGLLDMSPVDLEPVSGTLTDALGPNPCSALINLTLNDVVAPVIDLETIALTLEGVDLLQLTVDGAESDITGADATLTSTATQAFVTLTGPALDFLPGTISGLLNGIEDALQTAIEGVAGDVLPEGLDISDAVQEVVDALPEFGSAPLLQATISGGAATATLDNGDATTTSGGDEPYVEVTFAPGILELLGLDPEMGTQRFEAGQEPDPIAAGTPLESTISVGALTTDDDAEFEDTGMRGSTATASATTVSLLTGVEGGIVLSLARSDAGVYASTVTAAETPDEDDDPLPNTGGGAAFAAALALGAALVLRRRRD